MKHTDNDFKLFLEASEHIPSHAVTQQIFDQIRADLNPAPSRVFSKLVGIHFLVSILTLMVCPQFGFQILSEGMGLMHFFMAFGTYGCAITCGSFFLSTSLLTASFLLKGEELRVVRNNRWLGIGAISLLSFGVLFMLATEVVFGVAVMWFLGAVIGSFVSIELCWRVRFGEAK